MKDIPFWEHIEELRKNIIIYLVFFIGFFITSMIFLDKIIYFFTRPLNQQLVFFSPQEGFLFTIKLGFLSAFILSLPILLFLIWKYISGALSKNEKNKFGRYLIVSGVLFLIGVSFVYFLIIPFALNYLINYGERYFSAMISIGNYFSFLFFLFMVFGIVFQLPLIILFFHAIGIIKKEHTEY